MFSEFLKIKHETWALEAFQYSFDWQLKLKRGYLSTIRDQNICGKRKKN